MPSTAVERPTAGSAASTRGRRNTRSYPSTLLVFVNHSGSSLEPNQRSNNSLGNTPRARRSYSPRLVVSFSTTTSPFPQWRPLHHQRRDLTFGDHLSWRRSVAW